MADAALPAIDCQVLVVGAGPTGLMAANLLRRSGVAVRIVDDRTEASRESRAFAVMARSMELFAQLGLADRFLDRGVVKPRHRLLRARQPRRRARLRPGQLARYALPVHHPPPAIPHGGGAHRRPGPARRRGRAGRHRDGGQPGCGLGHNPGDGARWQGCDDPQPLRRGCRRGAQRGAQVAGAVVRGCQIRADPSCWPIAGWNGRSTTPGSACSCMATRSACSSRWTARHGLGLLVTDHSNKADLAGPEGSRLDLSEMEPVYRNTTGMEVRLSDAVWTTRYRVSHRGVPRYGEGRVFVAGDAAHIHSPAGGQGMNTGLQDAANLAWKLAATLAGAPSDLLDSYDSERRPVGQQVVKTSDKMFSAAAGQTGWEAGLRDWLARPVSAAISRVDAVQHRAFRRLSQLEIAYGPSRFVAEAAPGLGKAGPAVGQRAPNAAIARHLDVFDLLAGYTFTVLALSRQAARVPRRAPGCRRAGCACHRSGRGAPRHPAGSRAGRPRGRRHECRGVRNLWPGGARRPGDLPDSPRRLRGLACRRARHRRVRPLPRTV